MNVYGVRKRSRFNYEVVYKQDIDTAEHDWIVETHCFTERGALRVAKREGSQEAWRALTENEVKLVPAPGQEIPDLLQFLPGDSA